MRTEQLTKCFERIRKLRARLGYIEEIETLSYLFDKYFNINT